MISRATMEYVVKLEKEIIYLKGLLEKDLFVDMFNKVTILAKLDACVDRRSVHNTFSIIMCDIDFFKRVNDTKGHAFGDSILKSVANTMKLTIRSNDICGRYGGEEFIIILPDTNVLNAHIVAEKVREAIQKASDGITMSFGVAEITHNENALELITRADKLLYRAKDAGRNQVISF